MKISFVTAAMWRPAWLFVTLNNTYPNEPKSRRLIISVLKAGIMFEWI